MFYTERVLHREGGDESSSINGFVTFCWGHICIKCDLNKTISLHIFSCLKEMGTSFCLDQKQMTRDITHQCLYLGLGIKSVLVWPSLSVCVCSYSIVTWAVLLFLRPSPLSQMTGCFKQTSCCICACVCASTCVSLWGREALHSCGTVQHSGCFLYLGEMLSVRWAMVKIENKPPPKRKNCFIAGRVLKGFRSELSRLVEAVYWDLVPDSTWTRFFSHWCKRLRLPWKKYAHIHTQTTPDKHGDTQGRLNGKKLLVTS